MKLIVAFCFFLCTLLSFSQNNYIVKTEDGRRVLLKNDFTWEYIDMPVQQGPKANPVPQPILEQPPAQNIPPAIPNCGLGKVFREPKLNQKTQSQLKRSRTTMKDLKRKVAKDFNCTDQEVTLISLNEDAKKGNYTFCVQGQRIEYKRVGNSFFKKNSFF